MVSAPQMTALLHTQFDLGRGPATFHRMAHPGP